MFLGGADQAPQLRAESIKGALRWWYRAMDPVNYRLPESPNGAKTGGKRPLREDILFGGTDQGAGQSRMLLRIEPLKVDRTDWSEFKVREFNTGHGRRTRNGLRYLGYPFELQENGREAFAPNSTFDLCVDFPRVVQTPEHRRGVLGSLWLLGHFGALGTRSRRGFGSLNLLKWAIDGSDDLKPWQRDFLPDLATCKTVDDWQEQANRGLETLWGWFQGGETTSDTQARHPHLGRAFDYRLSADGFLGSGGWRNALAHAGSLMQDFRLHWKAGSETRTVDGRLQYAPDRTTFGLPLTFRGNVNRTFVPTGARHRQDEDFDRHASLLMLKLVKIQTGVHPLWVRMDGAVPGFDPVATVKGIQPPLPPRRNAMQEFFDGLE